MVQLVKHDLEFILKQIKIAEAHAAGGNLSELVGEAGVASGASDATGVPLQSHLLPYGLRTVDGSYNNLIDGRETWAAADQPFVPLVTPNYINEGDDAFPYVPGNNNNYGQPGNVADADPRHISNLIVDQTSNNPAAKALYDAMVAEGKDATRTEMRDSDNAIVTHTEVIRDFQGNVIANIGDPVWIYTFENISPDIGDSAPYNSMFTLFGQFFDHGLDLIAKGGNGTVYIPLAQDDPLYNPASPQTNFMAMTRISQGAVNTTTPWVDQNQTYTSHSSHQVFLREYTMLDGKPVSTGSLLEGDRGLATWADVKEQARTMLGIELTDADVGNVPLLRTDAYGNFIPDPVTGFAQIIVGIGSDNIPNTSDDIVISGTADSPASTAAAVRTAHAFLDDIAHAAVPSAPVDHDRNPATPKVAVTPDDDDVAGNVIVPNMYGIATTYDNELLDAHYITGDGRGNENIGLTSIHHVFHSEHNHLVNQTKSVVLSSGDRAFINEWLLVDLTQAEFNALPTDPAALSALSETLTWDGERLFQAARFTNEMEYQHLVFEEFGRKMQPDIDAFLFEPSTDVNPAIFAEFAQAVYRFGHSMLNENIDRLVESSDPSSPGYIFDNITLFDGFLNPLALGAVDADGNVIVSHEAAAGAVIRGMSRQGGNEIDEFVTNVLRNQLVGIPLDLAAINIARGRDVGLPTLNEARAQFFGMAGQDTQLKPYVSWVDFALNISNPASIVNFIAAYGQHQTILDATTIEGKRAAATLLVLGGAGEPSDRFDFLNSTGAWASAETGLNTIDLWVGGLAEKKMDFGGMLGSTFSFVFELQMEHLQEGDRFYYLSRVQGLNLLNELENNSLSEIIMRNTDLGDEGRTALPGDIFSTPDLTLEMTASKQIGADPTFDDPFLQALTPLVVRKDTDGDGDIDTLIYNGSDHVVIGGTSENDTLVAGEGDDTVWGYEGDDTIEGGYGVDRVFGGEGDDIITNAGTDIGATDFLHGNEGNDVIHGGNGLSLIFGNQGQDFIIAGPDGQHVLGGLGNDFIRGGDGGDFLMGNEGDDWIEGGARFDTLAGENSELFFNSTIVGHDVLNGGSSDTDYDAESGDDIMFQNEGIQRSNGMAGFDWAIHKGDAQAANSDLGIPLFATQEAFILRDRFDLVEGLSGWNRDDVLTGRASPTNARAELQNTSAIPGSDSPLDSYSNALLQKNVGLVDGLDALVAHKARIAVVDDDGNPVLDEDGNQEFIVLDTADASDILLGGGGSDVIKGLAGNDIIDGDRWLNVRIRINDMNGNEIGSADGMTTKIYDAAGAELFGGRTLDELTFTRVVNPGQLEIVREMLDGDVNNTAEDVAVFTDVRANYTITRNSDGSITVDHTGFDGDTPAGGTDDDDVEGDPVAAPRSDGADRLFNIEVLRFTDGDIRFTPPDLNLVGPSGQYLDSFGSSSYGNSNGTTNWAPDWVESSDTGVSTGSIRIIGGDTDSLRFGENSVNGAASITRAVNLEGATTAKLSFSVDVAGFDSSNGEVVRVYFSANGGTPTLLESIGEGSFEGTHTLNLSGPFTSAAFIRFETTRTNANNEYVYIDNVSVDFTRTASANYETTFTEGDSNVDIAVDPQIIEDGGEIVSARIVLTNAQVGDDFDIPDNLPGGIDSDVDSSVPGQIVVTLTGVESLANYQAAIEAIKFANNSQNPSTVDRIINITVNDGLSDSNVSTATVNVVPVNDDPNATDDSVITNFGNDSFVIPEWALLANDTDPDSVLNITSVSENATSFTATRSTSGDVNVSHTTASGRQLSYTVSDGSGTDSGNVVVTRDVTGAIDGTNGANILLGNSGSNTFDGGAGNDIVLAGGGNDTIVWNANATGNTDGHDIVDGGSGTDTFVVTGRQGNEVFRVYTRTEAIAAGIIAINAATEIVITRNGTDSASIIAQLDNVEEIRIGTRTLDGGTPSGGSAGNNDQVVIIGNFNETSLALNTITIDGSEGDDTIDISALTSAHRIVFRSNGGTDTIVGNLRPQDVVELPEGALLSDFESSVDENGVTTMSDGTHIVSFTSVGGMPQFSQHNGNDGHDDDDHDDDDSANGDVCDSGTDNEPAASTAVSVKMGTPQGDVLTGTDGDDDMIAFAGDDVVIGNAGADTISAAEGNDFANSGDGRDIVFAGVGDDQVFGGAQADIVFGDAGADRIFGDAGNDLLNAGAGSDTVFGGAGNDLIVSEIGDGDDTYFGDDSDGGVGIDTLDISAATVNVTVNLGSGVMAKGSVVSSQTGNDTIWGIENVNTGSGNDTITASNAVNVLDGGAGNDTFRFLTAGGADGDTIVGFEPGDRIDLSAIDADVSTAGDQSFTLVSGAEFTAAGQLAVTFESRADGDFVILQGNTDGNSDADFTIEIAGHRNLTDANLIG